MTSAYVQEALARFADLLAEAPTTGLFTQAAALGHLPIA
jgi:hypothetical protein